MIGQSQLETQEAAHRASTTSLVLELENTETGSELSIRALEEEVERLRELNAKLSMKGAVMTVYKMVRMQKKVSEVEERLKMEQAARRIETGMLKSEMHDEVKSWKKLHNSQMRSAHEAHQAALVASEKAMVAVFNEALDSVRAQLQETEDALQATKERLRLEEEAHIMTRSTLNKELMDLRQQTAKERSEHHAEMEVIRGQNAVLRDRLAIMHSTLHGMPPPDDYFHDSSVGVTRFCLESRGWH